MAVAPTPDVRALPASGVNTAGVVAPLPMFNWRALASLPGVHLAATEITDASTGTNAMADAHALRTHSNLELRVTFDSLIGWNGLTMYAQHKTKTGRNGSGSASLVQDFSNIDADDFRAFGEVFLEQRLFDDRLRIKAGRLDFNTEFAGTIHGAAFLNASMGFSPAITAAPTFPLPTEGLNVFVSPTSDLTVGVGVFNGLDGAPAALGATSRFHIAQVHQQWQMGADALDGRLGVGAWRHTGLFLGTADDPDTDPHVPGTGGWFATLDQTLWRGAKRGEGDDDQRAAIAGFAQFGHADPSVQAVHSHQGGGVTLSGLWARRASDVVGLGVTNATWGNGHERIHEVFYQLPVTSHVSLVGDWQRVGRWDDGSQPLRGNVFTLRTILSF